MHHSWCSLAPSDRDFRQDIHALNLRRDSELRSVLLHAHNRRLATHPAPLPGSEFRRKNQHQFHLAPFLHAGFGIEENAVGANVARLGSMVGPLGRTYTGGDAGGDAASSAAFSIGFHRWAGSSANAQLLYTTPSSRQE